jgi:hypothetical protein
MECRLRSQDFFAFWSERKSVEMFGDLLALQRRQLLQLVEADREDILKEQLGGAGEQLFQGCILIGRVPAVDLQLPPCAGPGDSPQLKILSVLRDSQ